MFSNLSWNKSLSRVLNNSPNSNRKPQVMICLHPIRNDIGSLALYACSYFMKHCYTLKKIIQKPLYINSRNCSRVLANRRYRVQIPYHASVFFFTVLPHPHTHSLPYAQWRVKWTCKGFDFVVLLGVAATHS